MIVTPGEDHQSAPSNVWSNVGGPNHFASSSAMWKTLKMLGIFTLMVVCGVVAFVAALTFLMGLGSKLHDNYEYYRGCSALVLVYGCGAMGFLAPAFIVRYLYKHSWRISLRTLFIAMLVVAVILGTYVLSL